MVQIGEASVVSLFQLGDFTLASGAKGTFKIECDALTEEDWAALAVMLVERLPHPFEWVYGVPRGGKPLADAMGEHVTYGANRILVVDDVWTTGNSMNRFIQEARIGGIGTPFNRAVVFARNSAPDGVTALFTMAPKVAR